MNLNHNALFAITMFTLMLGISILTAISPKDSKIIIWSVPQSKGCAFPIKEVRHTKTEMKHIVPYSQIHKCSYDHLKRLVKVDTYNFERGYQMKKPTESVLYKWDGLKLVQFSIRKATHGNGEVDTEVYHLLK